MKFSWPIISIGSRLSATLIGLVQSIIIVKILSVSDYGLWGTITGIGASVGVYQNLGISSGSTREIAAADGKEDVSKVFLASLLVRYLISIPLVIILFFFAGFISEELNNRSEIILPLRLFALTLLIQALQSTLNSVISGMKAFKFLFIFQVVIAAVSLLIFIPFLMQYQLIGYFYGLLAFNLVSTLVLAAYVYRLLDGHFVLPSKKEFWVIVKSVFAIGLFVYLIRIIDTQWQKLGPFVLAFRLDDYMIGLFSFALLVTSKIVVFSDAITDVTLPSMSALYKKSLGEYKDKFLRGNSASHILIATVCVLFILFKELFFQIIDFIFMPMRGTSLSIGYRDSFVLMDPLVLAFWSYSQINLLRSGFSVPAKKLIGAVISHGILFLGTYLLYTHPPVDLGTLTNFALAMGISGLVAYISMLVLTRYEAGFYLIRSRDLIYLIISVFILVAHYVGISPYILGPVYMFIAFYAYKSYRKN